jgi:hypothetical protein
MDSNGPPLASVGIFEMTRSQSVQAGPTINGRHGLENTSAPAQPPRTSLRKPASSTMATPNSRALSNLDPALSPASR